LLGERVEEGPVHSLMNWAYGRKADELAIIHIRDWHSASDPTQEEHLKQFGHHCIAGTEGANFVFSTENRSDRIVNASGLNDFVDTDLDAALAPFKGKKIRVGI